MTLKRMARIRTHIIAFCMAILLFPFIVRGEEGFSHPVTSVYSLSIGRMSALDTYIAPITFTGPDLILNGQWSKALPCNPERLKMQFDARLGVGFLKPVSRNCTMYDFDFAFSWGLSYRWRPAPRWHVSAGGALGFDGGCLYLPNNGNNPAAARLTAGLSLRGSVSYNLKIKRLPVLISDEVSLPTLNAFFAPDYAETYYEIYLGNHSGLAHVGWWGNHFQIDNLLAFDLDFGSSALRLGYRFRVNSSWINHIDSRMVTHAFEIGFIPGGIGLRPAAKPKVKAERISSLY